MVPPRGGGERCAQVLDLRAVVEQVQALHQRVFPPAQLGDECLRDDATVQRAPVREENRPRRRGGSGHPCGVGAGRRGELRAHLFIGRAEAVDQLGPRRPQGRSRGERLVDGRGRRAPAGKEVPQLVRRPDLGLRDVIDDLGDAPLALERMCPRLRLADPLERLVQLAHGGPHAAVDLRRVEGDGALAEVVEHAQALGRQGLAVHVDHHRPHLLGTSLYWLGDQS